MSDNPDWTEGVEIVEEPEAAPEEPLDAQDEGTEAP